MSGAEKLLDAMGEVSEELISEAAEQEKMRRGGSGRRRLAAGSALIAAAAAVLAVGSIWNLPDRGKDGLESNKNAAYRDTADEGAAQTFSTEAKNPTLYIDSAWLNGKSGDAETGDTSDAETSMVRLQIDATTQIWPRAEENLPGMSKIGKLGGLGGTSSAGANGQYFALQIGVEEENADWKILSQSGVTCSVMAESGEAADFSQETTCHSGDNVWFCVEETKSSETESTETEVLPETVKKDWKKQGIQLAGQASIQNTAEKNRISIYFGVSGQKYYLFM